MSASFSDVQAAQNDSTVILDVRNTDEVQKHGKIPGAHCVPLPEFEEALGLDDAQFEEKYGFPKPKEDDAIITHCMKGGRAAKATEALAAKGYQNAKTYEGSFTDWQAQGGEVDRASQ
ncbi:Rhodanese-like domain [Trinorchestia longiramus]|nr:Rhodanese-like domain [Trinorchestia longiramus]